MLSISPSVTANTLSLKPNNPNDLFLVSSPSFTNRRHSSKPISAIINPSSFRNYRPPPPPQQQVYQPFRPPPEPLPSQYGNLDIAGRIDILADRLGLWYQYAPLISSLIREGFSPPTIEETTGISGVEQNRLIVAAQVRDSLVESNADPELLAAFDTGGAELLYELRLLSTSQRVAAALFLVENRCDGKAAKELARAMKDFPSRRGDKGWESFDYTLPGDCLSFMYYRQAREHRNPSEQRTLALEQALRVAETERARNLVLEELERSGEEQDEAEDGEGVTRVPVVRLRIGEVAEARSVVVLPVCAADEREVLEAPFECRSEGEFGVVVAEKGWGRWVALPGWDPLVGLGKGGVVVSFADARVLPWKANRWYREEAILVVADRSKREVGADDGFYLVNGYGDGKGLKVERGFTLKEKGFTQSLGAVLLVVRPPKEEDDDQLRDEDWD
ncbi:rubisco accumulation factor 1.1, chloroplastic [Vigna radiata var. radiata]|uniref:Rubisco accumulation factor 1.1, chloroplastic n=1 Tax=Vigna radiata var. radiata TaxID=3916 RepID=A0A1S3UXX4_VIGRR|nr:rubisco accumulation factor 1.1, chloroplastic [Vigna radiata var. radiata]